MVKVAAMQALQSIAGLRDGAAVAPLLGDSDVGVRAEAATTLGMFHDANGDGRAGERAAERRVAGRAQASGVGAG